MSTFQKGQRVQVRTVDGVLTGVVTNDGILEGGMESCLVQVLPDGWNKPENYQRRFLYPLIPEAEADINRDAIAAAYSVSRSAAKVKAELLREKPF